MVTFRGKCGIVVTLSGHIGSQRHSGHRFTSPFLWNGDHRLSFAWELSHVHVALYCGLVHTLCFTQHGRGGGFPC